MVSSPEGFAEREFWNNMDAKTKALIGDEEDIYRKLEENKRVLNSQGELMASVSAFLNQSQEFEAHFYQLQMKIAEILGDEEKIANPELLETEKASYVKPEYAHVTLLGNLLANWDQSVDAGSDLEDTLKEVSKTSLISVGPHLSEGMSVIYQLSANDDQLINLRQSSEDWIKKYNQKAYIPPIFSCVRCLFLKKQLKIN